MSLALHFRFIEIGDFSSDVRIAVRLLARVLWSIRPHLEETGPLIVRMEKPFYTQYLGGRLETGWRDSIRNCRRWPQLDPDDLGELDRIFSIVLSGRLAKMAGILCKKLDRSSRYSFLFCLAIDPENRYQEAIYLSAYNTPIGVLHADASLELAFSAIEYCPDLVRMLALLKMPTDISDAACATAFRLIK
jgi:hypothetical protein